MIRCLLLMLGAEIEWARLFRYWIASYILEYMDFITMPLILKQLVVARALHGERNIQTLCRYQVTQCPTVHSVYAIYLSEHLPAKRLQTHVAQLF